MARTAVTATSPAPKWLRQRIAVWQRRCNLDEWEIGVGFRKMKDGALTSWQTGYKKALMEFDPDDYANSTEQEVDRQIAHEMYHILAAREDDAIRKIVGESGTLYSTYSDEQEHVAEHFASIMVKAYKRKRE